MLPNAAGSNPPNAHAADGFANNSDFHGASNNIGTDKAAVKSASPAGSAPASESERILDWLAGIFEGCAQILRHPAGKADFAAALLVAALLLAC